MSNILTIKHHRYKLNENSKVDRSSVNGVILTKEWSHGSMNPKKELEPFIMTKANPEGTVDYEIYIPSTKESLYHNREAMSRKIPIYEVAELLVMKRSDLVYAAEYYGIDVINKSNQFLISLITQLQKKRAEEEGSTAPEPVTPAQAMNAADRKRVMTQGGKGKAKKETPEVW